MKKIYINIA